MGKFIFGAGAVTLGGLAASVGAIWSLATIVRHLRNYKEPSIQRYIVRILLIIPIYSVASFFSLAYGDKGDSNIYVEIIRDIYEAVVVYTFLVLILAYGGGENSCLVQMVQSGSIKHPFPMCMLPRIRMDAQFLRNCKKGALQFVFVKPIISILSIVMLASGKYHTTAYQAILFWVYNISYAIALYALMLFYVATQDFLAQYNTVRKFFAVKSVCFNEEFQFFFRTKHFVPNEFQIFPNLKYILSIHVIFMTFWQMICFDFLPGVNEKEGQAWNNFILCFEMIVFAWLHERAFPVDEIDYGNMIDPTRNTVRGNMRDVIALNDVVNDALYSFNPAYQDYAQAQTKSGENLGVATKKFGKGTFVSTDVTKEIRLNKVMPSNSSKNKFKSDGDEFNPFDTAKQNVRENSNNFSGDHEDQIDVQKLKDRMLEIELIDANNPDEVKDRSTRNIKDGMYSP